MAKIFWVDEEDNVSYPDVKYLEYRGHLVAQEYSAGGALDWFLANKDALADYAAFVIDVQLPIHDDQRFVSEKWTHGAFAGLRLCELLEECLGRVVWERVRARSLMYTRLPDTSRMHSIQEFAEKNGIAFRHKADGASLVGNLVELRLIS